MSLTHSLVLALLACLSLQSEEDKITDITKIK